MKYTIFSVTATFAAVLFVIAVAPVAQAQNTCPSGTVLRQTANGCVCTAGFQSSPSCLTQTNSKNSNSNGQIQNPNNNLSSTLINPLGTTSASTLLTRILSFVVQIGSIVVIFMLVYVGFLFVTARGNETKITKAREALMWTIVGALILLGAQAIALGIEATVNAISVGG